MSSDRYFEGVVDAWIGDGKNYGFVRYTQDSGRENRVFFPASSIRSDAIGRRGHSAFSGALVRFRIEGTIHKGQSKTIAVDVHPVFPEEVTVNLADHREVSQVTRVSSGRHSLWLCREDGSDIFLHEDNVLPEHLERFQQIQTNDFVYHGIDSRAGKWGATCAEIFSRHEQTRLQQGLPAQEPELVPEILAPENKSKSLIQLSLERRRHEFPPKVETKL
jgi:hypothetical protein